MEGAMETNGIPQAKLRKRRIAYFVSRFPVTTETFIVRELDDVARRRGVVAELFALFPAPIGATHELARPWMSKVHHSSPLRAARGIAWCLGRHPWRTTHALAHLVKD